MTEAILHGIILAFGLIIPLGAQNVFVSIKALQPKFSRVTASYHNSGRLRYDTHCRGCVQVCHCYVLTFAWLENIILGVGIMFLLYMGSCLWRTKRSRQRSRRTTFSMRKTIIFAASVSLLNPHAILDTIGVIGTNSLVMQAMSDSHSHLQPLLFHGYGF